ncbi:MAG: GNAT family N-acetyltransferase [Dehalococcoidia bacterium]|nr:GNAT family N-acetyltransferase [Dehalococcoidia bacterium]
MRVAEDTWRQGIGTRLTEVAIDWCRHHEIRNLVLSTTTPQKPAICLYHKLGFREAARTFIDRYELVWLRLEL